MLKALDVLGAERIGHGYRVLEDETIYRRCLQQRVHFECCPTSSLMTGSVRLDAKTKVKLILLFLFGLPKKGTALGIPQSEIVRFSQMRFQEALKDRLRAFAEYQ